MLGSWLTRARLSKLRRANSLDDSFYEETTQEEWKVLKRHTTSKEVKKKKSQLTSEDMLLMQTNVLSAIPECFDLQAPFEHVKKHTIPKERRPPRTSESLKKKSPNEPYVGNGIPPQSTRNSLLKQERRKAKDKNERPRNENTDGNRSEPRGLPSDDVIHDSSSSNGGTNCAYQKMRSKIKLKTKTKVHRKRSNTAPPLRRSPQVEEEVSLTEFRRLETRISFSSYVKRRTPLFSFSKSNHEPKFNKLRRTEARNDIKLCGISGFDRDFEDKSDKNLIFNPIFEDEEPDEITSSSENMSTSSETDPHGHVMPNHVTRDAKHDRNKNVTFDLKCLKEEPESNTLNTENVKKRSETDPHVLDKNDEVIPNHVTRESHHSRTKNVTFDLKCLKEESESNTFNTENVRKGSETDNYVLDKNDDVIPNHVTRDSHHNRTKQATFDLKWLEEESKGNTFNTENVRKDSETDNYAQEKNYDVISNHVKRPPLLRSDHIEEEEELETTDISVDLNALLELNYDDENDYEFLKRPIITFDTTSIRRDLYIIVEEPENELVFDP